LALFPVKRVVTTTLAALEKPVVEKLAAETLPLNVPVTPVTTLPANDPLASRKTIVDAPLAVAAVVRALAIVPLEMFDALMLVSPAPLPDTAPDMETNVPTLAAKEPLESRATMVEAPFAEAAVVAELGILVRDAPDPLNKVAVTTFPAKEPLVSLATIVEAPLALAAVVLALAIVPAEILDALILVMVKPAPVKFAADTLPVKAPAPVAVTFAVEILRAATLPV
jgi:hypothetical protein